LTDTLADDDEVMFPEDEPDTPFSPSDDTTTPLQRLHYFALCWLKADKFRPLDKAKMRERITELGQETMGRRFPAMSWEEDTVAKLAELLEELGKSRL